jgi:hypothetical protein
LREILARPVIFGDVVLKLAELVEEGMLVGPLIDQQAIAWDVETLSQEQHLVQSLYWALSESDLQDLYEIVELGPVALIGGTFTLPLWVPKGPYNKVNRIPCFKGDKSELKTVEPWWRYGTMLAARISSLGCKGCRVRCIRHHRRFKSVRYSPGRTYGPAHTRCAENSTAPSNVDYTKVGQLVRSMTRQERGEATAKSQLMEAFRTRLSDEQYERIPKLMNGE